jgi:hypothetical protein
MAKRANSPRQIARSVELALVAHLKKQGSFSTKECAVIEFTESGEAPDELPCIVVKCVNVPRTGDTSLDMYSKTANVTATLVTDSEQNNLPQYEAIAADMECILEDLDAMKLVFNKPESGRDRRPVRGLHLHYIDEFQTDTDTSGTQWEFGVGCSLILDQVAS